MSATKPVMYVLFGGEGGACAGYAAAGFEVRAVELDPNRAKYNPHTWHVGDWREGLRRAVWAGDAAAFHASPPCQRYSRGTAAIDRSRYPDLIGETRDALAETGLPYVIENVEDAARHGHMRADLTLCGSHFDLTAVDTDGRALRLERHRVFESNALLPSPWRPHLHDRHVKVAGVYGGARTTVAGAAERKGGYTPPDARVQSDLLGGVDWMSGLGRRLCIPPVYAQHIGTALLTGAVRVEQLGLFA